MSMQTRFSSRAPSWDPKYARHPGPPSGRLPEVRNVFESRDKAGRTLAESVIAPNKIRPARRRCENVNRSRIYMCNTLVTNRQTACSSSSIGCYNKLKSGLLSGNAQKTQNCQRFFFYTWNNQGILVKFLLGLRNFFFNSLFDDFTVVGCLSRNVWKCMDTRYIFKKNFLFNNFIGYLLSRKIQKTQKYQRFLLYLET